MRGVEGQGTGNIGVPQPTTKATLFPDYSSTMKWIKYFHKRSEFLKDNPRTAARVLPSLSDFERALLRFIPRLNYWEKADRPRFKLICAAAGTEEKLAVAAYYAQAFLKYRQTQEITQLFHDNPMAQPGIGLLENNLNDLNPTSQPREAPLDVELLWP